MLEEIEISVEEEFQTGIFKPTLNIGQLGIELGMKPLWYNNCK